MPLTQSLYQVVTVSTPGGGLAPQYRVQVPDAASNAWHLFRQFRSLDQALCCVQQLQQQGQASRLVRHAITPAA